MVVEAQVEDLADGVPLGVLDELAGYHLRRASHVMSTDFSRAMAGTGIRQVLFAILSIVANSPGINQGAAGRALAIQRANMVSLITELVEAGLIERRTAPDDRRAFALTVTPAGTEKIAECLHRIRAHEDRVFSGLSLAERAALIELLRRVEANAE